LFSGARTALRNVTAPAQSKIYTVINATTGGFSVVLRGAGPTTGVTILAGESAVCAWNGSDFIKISNAAGSSTFYTVTATAPTTASSNLGAYRYGTLSFSDTGIVQSMQTSVNSYFQNVMQNTSAGASASAEFIAYNDQGTASTNYATVGINSSGYSGTGSINAAGYGYFLTASTDLVLGTIGSNKIHFVVNSGATDAMLIDTASNVGIGVAPSPWYTLSTALQSNGYAFEGRSGTPDYSAYYTNSYLNAAGSAYIYRANGYATAYLQASGIHRWRTAPSGTAGGSVTFTEVMTLDGSGNLGIGTSSPSTKLHVKGTVVSNFGVLTVQDSGGAGTSAYPVIALYDSASTHQGDLGMFAGDQVIANLTSTGKILFKTNNTTVGTFDSAGNLGLGVTPSAWGSGYKALQVGKAGALWSPAADAGGFYQSNNSYFNGSNRLYLTNDYATEYVQTSGQHIWKYAPSGTAGNAITFTQAMTLDASGRLTVGYTSASNNETFGASGTVISKGNTINTFAFDQAGFDYNNSTKQGRFFSTASGGAGYMSFHIASGTQAMTLDASGNLAVGSTDTDSRFKVEKTGIAGLRIGYAGTSVNYYDGDSNIFRSGNGATERARIDSSGVFSVGGTSDLGAGLSQFFDASGRWCTTMQANYPAGGTYYFTAFKTGSTNVGSITSNGSITFFNTTSDYRLKTVIGPVSGAGERLDALEPVEYTWKSNGQQTRGFLAHKFQEIYSDSVTGAKDAVDAKGNPVYQAMQSSSSEVIADLVSEIQSLRKRLAAAGI
jgi:hypothetical protein